MGLCVSNTLKINQFQILLFFNAKMNHLEADLLNGFIKSISKLPKYSGWPFSLSIFSDKKVKW